MSKGPGFVKLFLGGAALLLAFRLGKILYHLLVMRMPDTFLKIPYEDILRRSEVSQTCSAAFEHAKTIEGVHTYEEAVKIIKASGYKEPLKFKGFLTDPLGKWQKIETEHHDTFLSFTYLNLTGYGSVWTAGGRPEEKVDLQLGTFFDLPVEQHRAPYASFLTFLKPRTVVDDAGHELGDYVSVRADTNFLGNFPRDVMATPIHAAAYPNTYALQYIGTKLWVFMSPEDMERYNPINSPSTLLQTGSEAAFFRDTPAVSISVADPGDLVYFPPHWGHAVVTKAGPNVMFALREPALLSAFLRAPFRLIEGVVNLYMTPQDERQFSHKRPNPVQRAFLMATVANSPCRDLWGEMMRREG
ncbi:hypothetical protein EON64_07595 [archaeon]|nr:MAG: hypothetical protein EON64_07595 [archaeon]